MKWLSSFKNLKNQKGQAVLEYVLLILMIFIVCLAIITGIARSTETFFNNYYGAYFECLLQTGELPSLGADGSQETECDDLYEPFTVSDGRGPIGGGNDGSNGDGSNNDKDNSDKDNSDNANNSGSGQAAGSSNSGGSGSINAGSSGFDSGFGGRKQKVPLSNADRGGAGDEDEDLGGPTRYNNFQQNQEFGVDGSGRSEYVAVYGTLGEEEKKEEKAPVIKAQNAQDPEQVLRGKRVPAKAEKKKADEFASKEELGLPDIVRILIIAAIILIIIVFFGGQVMQYQKSKD